MILEISDLKKNFIQGQKVIRVLNGLYLKVHEGESVAVLGQSGSGKSTLLSLMAGVQSADSGRIVFDGKNLVGMPEEDITKLRAQKIGIVFQQFHLLPHLTAVENVSLALEIQGKKKVKEEAMELLASVGLKERAEHLPSELSGGEKQRVAMARALALKPALLLADEPSGSLDEKTGEEVMNILFDLVKERKTSMILVTHNKDLARRCDRILELDSGILKES